MQVCKGKVAIKRIVFFWWKILCWAFFERFLDEALADGVLSITSPQANLVVGGVARLHEAVVEREITCGGRRQVEVDFLWQMIGLSTQKAPGTFEH